jgi:hypothetical protein
MVMGSCSPPFFFLSNANTLHATRKRYLSRLLRSHWGEPVCVVEDATSPKDQPHRIDPRPEVYGRALADGSTKFRYRSRVSADNIRDKIAELERCASVCVLVRECLCLGLSPLFRS